MLASYTIDGFENIKYQGFGKLKFIENRLSELYERYGYCQVEPPTFENYDFYYDRQDVDRNELFKLISSTGKVLALKPDATLPVARMAAINHHDPQEIIKFSYQTNIYKDFSSPSAKKETTQAGIEYFGGAGPACEAEIIALAMMSLLLFGIKDFKIDLGHVGFITSLLDKLYLDGEEQAEILGYIENKNLGDLENFIAAKKIPQPYADIIMELPRLYGSPKKVLERMRSISVSPRMEAVVGRLENIYDYLKDLGLEEYLSFDIGFTNRMNYYTGTIFKGYITGLGEPVISGGRYDGLSATFGIDRPACGFSMDLIGLLDYLNQNALLPESEVPKFILLYDEKNRKEAFKICEALRKDRSAEMFLNAPGIVEKILKNPHYKGSQIVRLGETSCEIVERGDWS